MKKSSLWLFLLYVVVDTYCCYKKARRTMHTAIVLYLHKKDIQPNEACLGHKFKCTVFIRRRTHAQLLMIYKTSTYFCPKDERESFRSPSMKLIRMFREERIRTVSNYELPTQFSSTFINKYGENTFLVYLNPERSLSGVE